MALRYEVNAEEIVGTRTEISGKEDARSRWMSTHGTTSEKS